MLIGHHMGSIHCGESGRAGSSHLEAWSSEDEDFESSILLIDSHFQFGITQCIKCLLPNWSLIIILVFANFNLIAALFCSDLLKVCIKSSLPSGFAYH